MKLRDYQSHHKVVGESRMSIFHLRSRKIVLLGQIVSKDLGKIVLFGKIAIVSKDLGKRCPKRLTGSLVLSFQAR